MYTWIWRRLPGSTWMRVVQALLLVAGVSLLLLFVVFPYVEPHLHLNDVTVNGH